ncbi:MAG TPA: NAD(P)-binding domain-containing protein [Steroidobacteraceae bacterium]|nr:NAD(P)-binding domain-containing protein [Steroidobacteraceae bacterium]
MPVCNSTFAAPGVPSSAPSRRAPTDSAGGAEPTCRTNEEVFDLAVLGAGPGGLSAAARAAQRGLSHVLLEAADKHANTVQQYQRRKHVMAEPSMLPLRSDIGFAAGRREGILEEWEAGIRRGNMHVRYRSEVVGIAGTQGAFQISLKCGASILARNVILALGVQGNPRRLDVAGENHPCVQTTLECADDHRDESIIIVGAGDSAIENAIGLAENNRVIIVNRGQDFKKARDANAVRIKAAIQAGKIQCHFGSRIQRIEADGASADRCVAFVSTPPGEVAVRCNRIILRLGAIPPRGFLEPIGVAFVSAAPDALPALSPQLESSVPGLYIIGALAGYPLIKQAMNQGYDVVERLLGHAVEPADHPVLQSKLRAVPFGEDVDEALALISKRVRLFRRIAPLTLRELVLASTVRVPESGHEIYLRGEYRNSVFNVLQGVVYLYSPGTTTMVIGEGQMFGALSLISGRPSDSSAVAGPDCVVLETPRSVVKKLLRTDQRAQAYLTRVYILRALKRYLMPNAAPETIMALAATAQTKNLAAGEALFSEGDEVDRLYVLGQGSVTLSRKIDDAEVVVAYCAAGGYVDCVGELSGEATRTVTARATVATEAISIDHATFIRELAHDTAMAERIESERAAQMAQYAHMQARPEQGKVLSFLMEHGVGEATSVLVIDESLCIGCDQCERACAATHDGVSRLDRKAGPSFDSLHLATSCRHCEQPHCMDDCPADAIHRHANGEVYIDDSCIGCGKCEENCPYGVIHMAEVPTRLSLIDRLLRRPRAEPPKTAVKCDMCIGRKGGPACVDSCPTGAAIRIHAEEVTSLVNKRAAAGS